jgi:hypothetical protein
MRVAAPSPSDTLIRPLVGSGSPPDAASVAQLANSMCCRFAAISWGVAVPGVQTHILSPTSTFSRPSRHPGHHLCSFQRPKARKPAQIGHAPDDFSAPGTRALSVSLPWARGPTKARASAQRRRRTHPAGHTRPRAIGIGSSAETVVDSAEVRVRLMRIYLDVCSIQRPLDDRNQLRVRSEAEAVLRILAYCESGGGSLIDSDALRYETSRNPHRIRRRYTEEILAGAERFTPSTPAVEQLAGRYVHSRDQAAGRTSSRLGGRGRSRLLLHL